MQKLLSFEDAKNIDRISQEEYSIPGILLMEQAGILLAQALLSRLCTSSKVCVMCGSGNNGGDAQVLARILLNKGIDVCVSFINEARSNLALIQYKILQAMGCPIISLDSMLNTISSLNTKDWIIDGIAGIGINRPLSNTHIMDIVNMSKANVLSVDVPSGLLEQMNFNENISIVNADITLSFGCAKKAMYYPYYRSKCGSILVENPGFPQKVLDDVQASAYLIEDKDICANVPCISYDTYKRRRGVVVMAAGSKQTPGAAYLAGRSIAQSFSGMVYALLDEDIASGLNIYSPSIITGLPFDSIKQPHTLLIGPGWGKNRDKSYFYALLDKNIITVLDADALYYLEAYGKYRKRKQGTDNNPQLILTPHLGEMKMLDTHFVEHRDLWQSAYDVSIKYNAIVVAKHSVSAVVYKDAPMLIIDGRNPALAKAGSGDVLSGILASYLAYYISSVESDNKIFTAFEICTHVAMAVAMHATLARNLPEYVSSTEDLIEAIPSLQNFFRV